MYRKEVALYLKHICRDYSISWEDYTAQLDYEFPMFKYVVTKETVFYVEVLLYFVELGLKEYRTILTDLKWIIKNE